jgi:hypothetical protein
LIGLTHQQFDARSPDGGTSNADAYRYAYLLAVHRWANCCETADAVVRQIAPLPFRSPLAAYCKFLTTHPNNRGNILQNAIIRRMAEPIINRLKGRRYRWQRVNSARSTSSK